MARRGDAHYERLGGAAIRSLPVESTVIPSVVAPVAACMCARGVKDKSSKSRTSVEVSETRRSWSTLVEDLMHDKHALEARAVRSLPGEVPVETRVVAPLVIEWLG